MKCQKRLIFVLSADDSKKSVTICTKYLSVFGRSNLALLENAMDYLLGSELPLCRCQPFISSFDISQTVAPKPINFTIFQKTQLDLSVAIKYFAQTAVVFFCSDQHNIRKMSYF